MFLTENLPMLIKGATLKQNEDGERFAYCKLVLEPFLPELARELGDEVADHLFIERWGDTKKEWAVRREVSEMSFNLLYPRQRVIVRDHPDLPLRAELTQVGVDTVKVTRPDEAKPKLRLDVVIVVPLAEPTAIDFVVRSFGRLLYFTFTAHQSSLIGELKNPSAEFKDRLASGMAVGNSATLSDGKGNVLLRVEGTAKPATPMP